MIRFVFAAFVALWSATASAQFLVSPSSATAGDCVKFGADRLHAATAAAPCAPANAPYYVTTANAVLSAEVVPSANVQTLLSAADFAAFRISLGLVIGTNVQAFDADLTTYAGITPAANTQTLLGGANFAAWRTSLGLVIGTNVQAFDSDLTTWAGVTPGAGVATSLAAASAEAYDATGWNGDEGIATKNDVRDRIEGQSGFRATLSADQTIADASVTTIAFDTEAYDTGSLFASNAWTPPAGLIIIGACARISGTFVALAATGISIYKDGAALANGNLDRGTSTVVREVCVNVSDSASGSNVYTARVSSDVSSGSPVVEDFASFSQTFFWGYHF